MPLRKGGIRELSEKVGARTGAALVLALALLAACDKKLPTEPAVQPTPTPTAAIDLTGSWSGTINATSVTASVTQSVDSVRIVFSVAGATGTSNFTGTLAADRLDGQFCRGNICGCSPSSGTASSSRIHLQTRVGNAFLDCLGNTIELAR